MASLNHAAREALPHMRKVAADNPNAQVLVRVLRFSAGASWVVEEPTPLQYFQWPELSATAGGMTDLGAALRILARELRSGTMPDRALPPVLVLCTDGMPTDSYREGLDLLLGEPWGAKAIRLAIGLGRDTDLETLLRFIANPDIPPLNARNAEDLVRYLQWASTSVLRSASSAWVGSGSDPGLRPPATPAAIYRDVTW
jgi:uncharacterized protein YegL